MAEQNTRIPVFHPEDAVDLLTQNISTILNVRDWANLMGFSRAYFSKKMSEHFGKSAKVMLRDFRYNRMLVEILRSPRATSRDIAGRIGLADDKALYKFLSRHFRTTFSQVRFRLLNAENVLSGEEDMQKA